MKQSTLQKYREVKEQLAQCLQSLADTPAASEVRTGSDENALTLNGLLLGIRRQVQADTFKVAVVGEYSSGKSSLLNMLMRLHTSDGKKADGLLPTAITPTTAVITTLVYDEARSIEITLDDGQKLQVSADQLNGFLTEPALRRRKFWWSSNEEENERLATHIRYVRIGCVSPLLGEGVELIDTPGIGSINEDHARITKEFTAEADAALFLVSVDPPMGEREMTFLQHIKTITDRCLFVQTKRDLGERTEHGETVWQRREKEHRHRIEEVLQRRDYPFYSVSAYQAARGLRRNDKQEFTDSGFEDLEAELQRFLVAERGAPRIEAWLKRCTAALRELETFLRVKQEQLEARLADSTAPVAVAEDYAQWQPVRKAVQQQLAANEREADAELSDQKGQFASEVMREAQRELTLTSGKQLAENPDRRLQIERTIVRSVQYHSDDLLIPVLDFYIEEAKKPFEEAVGNELPKAFQQFRSMDFNWKASSVGVDFSDLVETRTYIRKTQRGGLGLVDFFLGPVETEVTEHNLNKQRFSAMVEKTIEETFRGVKLELRSTLKEVEEAVKSEMDRIVTAAKSASDQQIRIQQQDYTDCRKQLQENQRQSRQVEICKIMLDEISASLHGFTKSQL